MGKKSRRPDGHGGWYADALNALRVLKAWLSQPEDEYGDRKVE